MNINEHFSEYSLCIILQQTGLVLSRWVSNVLWIFIVITPEYLSPCLISGQMFILDSEKEEAKKHVTMAKIGSSWEHLF